MSSKKRSNPNIAQIAELAGVSVASVSRALNGKLGIGDSLRAKILSISEELDYRPSLAARELNLGKNAVVAISMERVSWEARPYYDILFRKLTLILHRQGLVPKSFSFEETSKIHRDACAAIILGVGETKERAKILNDTNVPFISIESEVSRYSLIVDGRMGIKTVTKYLIDKGRTKIACLSADQGDYSRLQGYLEAVIEAGQKPQTLIHSYSSNFSLNSYRFIRKYIEENGSQFDAYICVSDEDAIGVLAALHDLGITVPDEVSVTGYDDLPIIGAKLTTLRQDLNDIAEQAVKLLLVAMNNGSAQTTIITPKLQIRQTA